MADEPIQVTAGEPRWSGDGSRVFVPVLVDGERQSELELEWDGSEFAPVTASGFDESKHPRRPKGSDHGGEFAPAGQMGDHTERPGGSGPFVPGDKVVNEGNEYGEIVKVNDDGTVDVRDTSFARNLDGSPAYQGRIYRGVPAKQFRRVTASAAEETDTDAENRAQQAEELCPYCNGTGRKGEQAMAASASLGGRVVPELMYRDEEHRFTMDQVLAHAKAWDEAQTGTQVLTAAAAGLVPDVPPLSWFEMREPDGPTPLTITADGQVYGHAALWNTCHTGQPGRCTTAPRSQSGYRFFHLGGVETEEGVTVATGKITFGAGHAPLTASRAGTASHYDNSAHAGADVVARDGRHGIWVTGALRPDLPAKVVRTLRAAALSGDWRSVNGSLELIGLLAVNVPGFPVPRAQAALAASADVYEEDAVEALVAAGVMLPVEGCEPCVEEELDELLALVAAADPLDELLAPVAIDNLLVDVGAASPQLAYAGPESTVPVVLDSQSAEDVRRRTRMQAARMVGNEPLAMALENAPDAVFESDSGKTVSVTVNIASAE